LSAIAERCIRDLCEAAALSARAATRLRRSVGAVLSSDGDAWSDVAGDLSAPLADDETVAIALRSGVIVGHPLLRAYSRHVHGPGLPRHIPLRLCAAGGAMANGDRLIVYVGDVSLELLDVWLWRVRAMLPVLSEWADDARRHDLEALASNEERLIDAVLESIAGHEEGHSRHGTISNLTDVVAAAASDRAADADAAARRSDAAVWMIAAYHCWAVANARRVAGPRWPEQLHRDPDWLNGALLVSAISSTDRCSPASIRDALQTASTGVHVRDPVCAALDRALASAGEYSSGFTAPRRVREAVAALAEAIS
jgi:hypothetical protein